MDLATCGPWVGLAQFQIYRGLFRKAQNNKINLWRCGVSNPVPLACKASALPCELHPLFVSFYNNQNYHVLKPTHNSHNFTLFKKSFNVYENDKLVHDVKHKIIYLFACLLPWIRKNLWFTSLLPNLWLSVLLPNLWFYGLLPCNPYYTYL